MNDDIKTKNEYDSKLNFLRQFFSLSQKQFAYKGIFLDGNHTFGLDTLLGLKMQTIIKGDAKIPLISAASIVAKVERDAYMIGLDSNYPVWQFGKHKGFGTKLHRNKIMEIAEIGKKVGGKDSNKDLIGKSRLTIEHRKSFLSKISIR